MSGNDETIRRRSVKRPAGSPSHDGSLILDFWNPFGDYTYGSPFALFFVRCGILLTWADNNGDNGNNTTIANVLLGCTFLSLSVYIS